MFEENFNKNLRFEKKMIFHFEKFGIFEMFLKQARKTANCKQI